MTQSTIQLMAKTAAYIEKTQPLIDAHNEQQEKFVKRATKAAGVLAYHGIIDPRRTDEFIDKAAADPSGVWDFVEQLVATLPADNLGTGVLQKSAAANGDAFEQMFFPEYFGRNSGIID